MSPLPTRFPRASLIQHAAFLESRINRLLDETNALLEEAEDRGMGNVTAKLAKRFNQLDEARKYVNEARAALWELP